MKVCPVCAVAVSPRATYCSGRCRVAAFRAVRFVAAGVCFECGSALAHPRVGRRRVRCGSAQCDQARAARTRVQEKLAVIESLWDFYDRSGVDENGYHLSDGKPDNADFRSAWAPECDIDPLAFAEGWDADLFVAEFGRSGPKVGQSCVRVGATLGAGCAA